MIKLGILFCAYGDIYDLISKSLNPWISYSKKNNNIFISACSFPFFCFPYQDNTETLNVLHDYLEKKQINSLFWGNEELEEKEARNKPLQWLKELKCDVIYLLDADVIVTEQEIENLIIFLEGEKNSPNIYYRINYRNLTFSENSYTDEFNPTHLFWVNKNFYQLKEFYSDNDLIYRCWGIDLKQTSLIHTHISRDVFFPLHFTWCDKERSIKKVLYQKSRGWLTEFNLGTNGKIVYNEEYFRKTGKTKPKLYNLEDGKEIQSF